ncbi:unnamed protein product [Cuscuta epithymum]|uniref:Uncharacterized protein n=1 Tax=Cuscuta epithymum TaxID=186058 RepID=A0AAV0DQJ9_9ASTE|nr:unnamed protein product [Cuscuta epithymum]
MCTGWWQVLVDLIITDLKTSDKTVVSTDIDSASMIPSLLRRDCERGSKQILILMNSGATLNLISQKLIEVVQKYYKAAVMFQAKMGKGEHISLQSSCEVLQIWVHHLVMTEDSYLLDLGEINVILGMGPLANHGNAEKIFSKHSIKWLGEGQYATKSLSLFFLAMLFRAMKGVTMKVGIRKV